MSVETYRESPRKFDSRTLNRKTLNRWTGRKVNKLSLLLYHYIIILIKVIIIVIIRLTS